MRSILVTQCLQEDFLRPLGRREPLPSLVHVGSAEAERLLGASGALLPFLAAAHAADPAELGIVHVVDRHDPGADREHLGRFRCHCLDGSPGARLVGPLEGLAASRRATRVVRSGGLNDVEGSDLAAALRELAGPDLTAVRVAVVGVWTDAKVSFLLYDLATRLRVAAVATCSALVASRSVEGHFDELRRLESVLDVRLFHSPASLLAWLGAPLPGLPAAPPPRWVAAAPPWPAAEQAGERDALLGQVLPDAPDLGLRALSGGFSGCQVLLTSRPGGERLVAKVGPRDEIARERFGNERVRRVLGDTAPAVVAHREGPTLAVMVQELAAGPDAGAEPPVTFRRLVSDDGPDDLTDLLEAALERVLGRTLARFYRTAELEVGDLLTLYGFTDAWSRPQFGSSVAAKARAIAAASGRERVADLLPAGLGPWLEPEAFYRDWLPGRALVREHLAGTVHGDLNLANMLVLRRGAGLERVWVLDFGRLGRLPNLTDFAKVENDLAYIACAVDDPAAEERALRLQQARLATPTLLADHLPGLAATPAERRHARLVAALRRLAAATDPRGEEAMELYRVALLRYAAHTLGFDEPGLAQKRLALAACARLACLVAESGGGGP